MNKKNKTRFHTPYPFARKLALKYILSLFVFTAGLILLVFLCAFLASRITWQREDPLYHLLTALKGLLPILLPLFIAAGWIGISLYFLRRPSLYLDELTEAAARLARPDDDPIVLSEGIKSAENQLNLVRMQVLNSMRAAKEAEQRKNDLIVYLAHDLKTPLTSVIGYLTLLRDEPQLSPALRARYTHIALEKAERLEELINEFFDITRFNLSHLELERCPTDLSRMLEQMASEFAPFFAEKSLRCTLSVPPCLLFDCDPDKMARVFENLLRNACHYTLEGGEISICGSLTDETVTLVFRNPGKTIPPEKLERIFDQFFRLDASRGSQTGGAGLGLAIAREIVEAHGGLLRAESADGAVSFILTLPFAAP